MREGYVAIDRKMARDIIKANHQKMSALSVSLGYSPSWLQHALQNGSLHTEDLKALLGFGLDLRPAKKVNPTEWTIKLDIGLILDTVIRANNGESIYSIADSLGIDWKTARRYIATWKDSRFGIKQEQLLALYNIIEKENRDASRTVTEGD